MALIKYLIVFSILLAISCQRNTKQEIWNLISKLNYQINCIDAVDLTTGKHFLGRSNMVDFMIGDLLEKKKHGYSCLKYDTSFTRDIIDSTRKEFEQLKLKESLEFIRTMKLLKTKFLLVGTYSIDNNKMILTASDIIDRCNNKTAIDTIIIQKHKDKLNNVVSIDTGHIFDSGLRVKLKCDSIDGMISIEPHCRHDTMNILLKTNDSLILRKTLNLNEWIDFVYVNPFK
jgi:hypothetical protein